MYQPAADKKKENSSAGSFPLLSAPSQSVNLNLSLTPSRLSFSVCNLSLLLCQARVKMKARLRLGLWLGRRVQGNYREPKEGQGYQAHIF